MLTARFSIILMIFAAASLLASVALAVEPELPQDKVVADLIEKLSSPDPIVRETADDKLYDLLPTAFPLLQAAANRTNIPPETAMDLKKAFEVQSPLQAARLRQAAQFRATYVFNETAALASYRSVGKHDPRWDKLAEDAIKAFIAPTIYPVAATGPAKLQSAIAAGCDDPLILYFNATKLMKAGRFDEALKPMQEAADAFHQSKYPAYRKVAADMRLLHLNRIKHPAGLDAALAPYLDASVAEFADACAEPNIPHSWVYEWAEDLTLSLMASGLPRKDAFDELEPALEKAMPNTSVPLVIKGKFYMNYAWDARGRGWANTVTNDGWTKMHERLAISEEALNNAWMLDPNDEKSSEGMLQVELGQGEGSARMEKWFGLAMQANPDDFDACNRKMYYLLPKWYGSEAKALDFARECGRTRRWSSRLPLLICDTHASLLRDAKDKKAYLAQPQVWADVQSASVRFLRQYNEPDVRNQYALWAWRCHQNETLNEQLTLLGDAAEPALFGGKEILARLKRHLAEEYPSTSPSPTSAPTDH